MKTNNGVKNVSSLGVKEEEEEAQIRAVAQEDGNPVLALAGVVVMEEKGSEEDNDDDGINDKDDGELRKAEEARDAVTQYGKKPLASSPSSSRRCPSSSRYSRSRGEASSQLLRSFTKWETRSSDMAPLSASATADAAAAAAALVGNDKGWQNLSLDPDSPSPSFTGGGGGGGGTTGSNARRFRHARASLKIKTQLESLSSSLDENKNISEEIKSSDGVPSSPTSDRTPLKEEPQEASTSSGTKVVDIIEGIARLTTTTTTTTTTTAPGEPQPSISSSSEPTMGKNKKTALTILESLKEQQEKNHEQQDKGTDTNAREKTHIQTTTATTTTTAATKSTPTTLDQRGKVKLSSMILASIALLDLYNQIHNRRHHVQFTTISVRDYETILEYNPEVRAGPAIGIGWTYLQSSIISVDEYESKRPPRARLAKDSSMRLSSQERLQILKESGYTDEELQKAIVATQAARTKRIRTLQDLGGQKERNAEFIEGAAVKIQRFLFLRRSSEVEIQQLWKDAEKAQKSERGMGGPGAGGGMPIKSKSESDIGTRKKGTIAPAASAGGEEVGEGEKKHCVVVVEKVVKKTRTKKMSSLRKLLSWKKR